MPLAQMTLRGWDAVLRNNLTGGFLVAREVYQRWMGDNGGAIVNVIADIWGGMPTMGHSGAARRISPTATWSSIPARRCRRGRGPPSGTPPSSPRWRPRSRWS